jgi:putative nucleotidyltransferase with HDIG domain
MKLLDLKDLIHEAGIAPEHFLSIASYLKLLKDKHESTYDHVLRVGKLAATMADYAEIPGVTPKMMMWAGLLHDVGKSRIPVELLAKTSKFTDEDRETMEPHVMHGWELLQKIHEYTAHVIVRHHRYGKRPYPKRLPPLPDHLELNLDTIEAAARLLALADYYDALTTRKNDRNGGLTTAEKRELYIRENPGCEALIQRLECAGVLTFESA